MKNRAFLREYKMFRLLVIPCLFLIFLEGCASSAKTSSLSLVSNQSLDSLRATFSLEFQKPDGGWQKFSAVLFSVPEKRYRLELSGPMGIGVASLLWTDSLWNIVFPTERTYLQGNGYLVGMIGNSEFPLVNIHQVASFFEQRILPRTYTEIKSIDSLNGRIVQATEETGVPFSFYEEQGKVVWLEKGLERVYFKWPEILVLQKGKEYLRIKVKKIKTDGTWNSSIWKLPIPLGYQKI